MTGTPQPGDIGLVRIKGDVGWAIQVGELILDHHYHESHAFLYLGDGRILEAEPGGARIATLDEYADREILWSTRQLAPEQRTAIVTAGLTMVGIPYGWEDYAELALAHFGIHSEHLLAHVNDGTHLICSQLCDRAWNLGGVHIFTDGRQEGDVTPGDLSDEIEHGRL